MFDAQRKHKKIEKDMFISIATLSLITPSILTTVGTNMNSVHADALTNLVNKHDDKGQDRFDQQVNNERSQYQGGIPDESESAPRPRPVYHPAYQPIHNNYNRGIVRPRTNWRAIRRQRAIKRQKAIKHANWIKHQRYIRHVNAIKRQRAIKKRKYRLAHRSFLKRVTDRIHSFRTAISKRLSHRLWQMKRAIRYHWHKWGKVCHRLIEIDKMALRNLGHHIITLIH